MTARPRETGRARRADVRMFALGAILLAVAFVWMVALLRQAPLPETVPDDPTPAIAPPPSAQTQRLHDEAFGVALDGLAMRRVVQMLQWRETDSPLEPGSEVASKADGYQQVWSERIIDSSRFRHPEGHANPPAPPYRSQSFTSMQEGADGAIAEGDWRIVPPARLNLPENLAAVFRAEGGWWISTPEGTLPAVGDLRVRFEVLLPSPEAAISPPDAGRTSSEPAGTAPDAVAQALRWMGRSAALLLAVLGAGLALRAGAAFARPGSMLARLNGAMLLAASAWVGVIAIVLAGLAARL